MRHVPGLACREQDVVTPIPADTRSDQLPALALRALLFHSGQRNAAASKGEPGAKAERIPDAVMRTNMLAGERRVPSGIRTSAWQVLWPADIGKFFDLSGGTAPQVPLTGVVDAARFQL